MTITIEGEQGCGKTQMAQSIAKEAIVMMTEGRIPRRSIVVEDGEAAPTIVYTAKGTAAILRIIVPR